MSERGGESDDATTTERTAAPGAAEDAAGSPEERREGATPNPHPTRPPCCVSGSRTERGGNDFVSVTDEWSPSK